MAIYKWRVTLTFADGLERIVFIDATTPWHAASRSLMFVDGNRRALLAGLSVREEIGPPKG